MRKQLIELFNKKEVLTTAKLARSLKVTRQAVHRHLRELILEGIIVPFGTSRKTTFYALNRPKVLRNLRESGPSFQKRYKRDGLEEDSVYGEIGRRPFFLKGLSPEAQTIFHYVFTEILNNAIDHSGSFFVEVTVEMNPHTVLFVITDKGVGIFENIRAKMNLPSEMEGLETLLKGKQTTLPKRHSGEGIFFASKAVERMTIESHRKSLRFDNRIGDIFVTDIRLRRGTRVMGEVAKHSRKKLASLFREYTNDQFQFDKTRVMVKLYKDQEECISRSQARRLLSALESFGEVILDFAGVETIGQGFADEVFRVFADRYPAIKLIPTNAGENVRFMINHVQKTAGIESSPTYRKF